MKNHIFVILSVLAWGISQFLVSMLLKVFPPAFLLFLRFFCSGIILIILAPKTGEKFKMKYFLTGGMGCFGYYLLSTFALEMTSVTFVAIMGGCLPVLAILSDILLIKKRPGKIRIMAALLSQLGIILYSYGGKIVWDSLAFFLMILANVAWLIYCYLKKKWKTGDDLKIIGYEFIASAVLYLPFLSSFSIKEPISLQHIFILGQVIVISTIIPYWLYAKGSANLPVTTSAIYMNLLPVATLIPVWITQETFLTSYQLAGIAVLIFSSIGNALGDRNIVN